MKKRKRLAKLAAARAAETIAASPAPSRPALSAEAAAVLARSLTPRQDYASQPAAMFAPAAPLFDIGPAAKDARITMDDVGGYGALAFAGGGLPFAPSLLDGDYPAAIPMQVLAVMAQRSEFFKISDVPAIEMTRRWMTLRSTDDTGGSKERIAGIAEDLRRFRVRDAFRDSIRNDGLMGRGHIYLDFGDISDEEALQPIGDGRDKISLAKVRQGSLRSVRAVDPTWCYALDYGTRDPLRPDFYKPQTWSVISRRVHRTRLLTMVGRDVPDLLKPAYGFGGRSLTQMAAPYVQNWLRTRQDVSDLVHAFNTYILKTNMAAGMQGGGGGAYGAGAAAAGDGASLDARVMLFSMMANNRGVFLLDKDSEEFGNVTAQLGTLDKLQAQAQEQMATVSSQPLLKAFGSQPTGLNASSDGEIRNWYDNCHAWQEDHVRDLLETVVDFIQLNRFGDVDPTIQVVFEPLWAMSEKDRAELEKSEMETDKGYVDMGVLWNHEVRSALAKDPDNRYQGLDVDDVPDDDPGGEKEQPEGGENGQGATGSADETEQGDPEGDAGARAVEGLFRDRDPS